MKFEKGLAMKYSQMAADDAEPQSKVSYGQYSVEMDADLLADLRKMNQ